MINNIDMAIKNIREAMHDLSELTTTYNILRDCLCNLIAVRDTIK